MKTIVLSVGGSLINPGEINLDFLRKLKSFIDKSEHRFVIIAGGGFPARQYMNAAKEFGVESIRRDEIGIKATCLNAELLRHIFNAPKVQQRPRKVEFKKVLIGAGWKPGCSTDYETVLFAKLLGGDLAINLSNTDYVYDKDPKKDSSAKPIPKLSWETYRGMIASEWSAGMNAPFDPVASRTAQKLKLRVICMNGSRLDELSKAIEGQPFVGTVIE